MSLKLTNNLVELAAIPSDINEHLIRIKDLVINNNCKTVVELGVRSGVSTQALLAGIDETGGKLYSYDIQPILPTDGPRNTSIIERLGHLEVPNWKFELGSSLEVYKYWKDEELDLIFIDTDHTPEQIYKELILWTPKVRIGGLIVMHDVAEPSFKLMEGITKFLREKPNYSYEEYTNNNGLGILWKEQE